MIDPEQYTTLAIKAYERCIKVKRLSLLSMLLANHFNFPKIGKGKLASLILLLVVEARSDRFGFRIVSLQTDTSF